MATQMQKRQGTSALSLASRQGAELKVAGALTKLAIRRQVAQNKSLDETLEVYAADLLRAYTVEEIEAACEKIGQTPRAQGETAMPELAVVMEACFVVRRFGWKRQQEQEEKAEAEQIKREQDEHKRRYATDPQYAAECDQQMEAARAKGYGKLVGAK